MLITHSKKQAERLAGKGAKVVDLGGGMVDEGEEEQGGEEEVEVERRSKKGKKGDSRV